MLIQEIGFSMGCANHFINTVTKQKPMIQNRNEGFILNVTIDIYFGCHKKSGVDTVGISIYFFSTDFNISVSF